MSHQASQDLDPVARLRSFIVEGGHPRGGRLPPERHLTEELGITRTTLRKALDSLERDGLIWRHVGKGTFISDDAAPNAPSTAMSELGRQLTPFRMMRARLAIEPAIAREAAVNASGEALQRMQRAIDRAKAATTWNEYETQDDLFHRAVAEASDNLLLLTLFVALLFYQGYKAILLTGSPHGIQGRYLLPFVPLLLASFMLATKTFRYQAQLLFVICLGMGWAYVNAYATYVIPFFQFVRI